MSKESKTTYRTTTLKDNTRRPTIEHVVGIFANREGVIRLIGAILCEQNDEWIVSMCHMTQETQETQATGAQVGQQTQELLTTVFTSLPGVAA